jgi:DNA transformation protein and related proteins
LKYMATQNQELSKVPNIGKVLAGKLKLAGINNLNQLRALGAENTFIKLITIDKDSCINSLYAIEGAIQGIRWHDLDSARKAALLEFFRLATKQI